MKLAQVCTLRKKLQVAEYKDHQKSLRSLQKKYDDWSKQLFDSIGRVSDIYVRKFIENQRQEEAKICANRHKRKLMKLGLDISKFDANCT